MNPTIAATAPPPRKHRRSNISWDEKNQPTVRFSKLRQYTDNLPAALLDALTSQVRNEVRSIRTAKGRGLTWQTAIQTAYDALDAITKASSPGEVAETILAISALRKAEGSLFLSDLTWKQQRVRLLLHLGRDRRRVESTAGTFHGTTREVRMPDQKAIEAVNRMIDRLVEQAEIACGKPPAPKPPTVMETLLAEAARGNYHVPNAEASHHEPDHRPDALLDELTTDELTTLRLPTTEDGNVRTPSPLPLFVLSLEHKETTL